VLIFHPSEEEAKKAWEADHLSTYWTQRTCTVTLLKSPTSLQQAKLTTNHIAGFVNDQTPGIERVQALADISRSALCCHSNETCAPIANLPNSAQLGGTHYHSPSYIRVRAVVWACRKGQTDTHRRARPLYISSHLFVSDIAIFVLKRDVKLQLTN